MGDCSRCGECCMWLPVAPVAGCDTGTTTYYRARGLREDGGIFLVYAPCPHLECSETSEEGKRYLCNIHGSKPGMCRNFDGGEKAYGTKYYRPPDCSMAEKT